MSVGEILYCHATRQTRWVGPGHWFFHTGQYAQCAAAWKDRHGKWHVQIDWAPSGKQLPDPPPTFGSIEEVTHFVSKFFESEVRKVKPTEFPEPDL